MIDERRIIHCKNCGDSWFDSGFIASCPICKIKELEKLAEKCTACGEWSTLVDELLAKVHKLENRLGWAIQLTDDYNYDPSGTWSERLNADIDAAIAEEEL